MDITQLLAFVMQNNASDLHLSSGNPPIIRVHGSLKRLKADVLTSDGIRAMLYSIMTDEQRAEYEKNFEMDFAVAFGEKARFRVNAFMNRNGTAAVLRTIPSVIPTMQELDLPPVIRRFAELEKGLILVTGATGSGKSTTLAAIINHINENTAKHILTIEDPVEFFHTSKKSLINHRELGADTKSFARALKSALREDPDVILVGEMRDHETIALALTAAETGHLVLGTLHANTAAKTIDRIIDVFPAAEKEMIRAMLSSSLQGVIAQILLKKPGGTGRVGCFEILVGTGAVRNLIRENQIPQLYSMLQTGSRYGMITMEDAVKNLLDQGLVDPESARLALLKTTDAEEDSSGAGGRANAALGGGQLKPAAPAPAAAEEEGYSF